MPKPSCLRVSFFFSSRRRHTRSLCDWSSDVCSSDLLPPRRTRHALGRGPRRAAYRPDGVALRYGAPAGEPAADAAGCHGRAVLFRRAGARARVRGSVGRDDARRDHATRVAPLLRIDHLPPGAAHADGAGQDRRVAAMIPFHRLLISTAIVFCAGFTVWAAWSWRESRSAGTLVLSLSFGVATVALSYYLRHLKRFLGR